MNCHGLAHPSLNAGTLAKMLGAGHPINFAGQVPVSGSGSELANPVPLKFADGKKAGLHHVVIPLDPDAFSWFTDLNRIGLEITKEVQFYRAYPDPFEYSWHGAGLPSSVQIYAMTLERVGIDLDLQPDPFGHVWTAPTPPTYKVELRNSTGKATTAKLAISTKSYDGKESTQQERQPVNVTVEACAASRTAATRGSSPDRDPASRGRSSSSG